MKMSRKLEISLRRPIYIVKSVDKTKLSCYTPTDAVPQFLWKLIPLHLKLVIFSHQSFWHSIYLPVFRLQIIVKAVTARNTSFDVDLATSVFKQVFFFWNYEAELESTYFTSSKLPNTLLTQDIKIRLAYFFSGHFEKMPPKSEIPSKLPNVTVTKH